MPKLSFPEGFLWGSATSANQIEGNNTNTDWWVWENSEQRAKELRNKNKNPEDFKSGTACDSYNRYEEDFDIAKSLNQNVHRFSIEWARIEPSKDVFDPKEIQHYRMVLQALKNRGIKTFVTLHHFTNPIWFAEIGGWEKRANIQHFIKYSEKVFLELGDLIDFVCTINEPNIYSTMSYLSGRWTPQQKSLSKTYTVYENMLYAHIEVYKLAKRLDYKFPLGVAQNMVAFEGRGLGKLVALIARYFYQKSFLDRIYKYSDFIGVNYYIRNLFAFSWKPPFLHKIKELPLTDFSWEIYPKGFYSVLKEVGVYKKPVYITENGLADSEDKNRKEFIQEHLHWMHNAMSEGVDVRGYMHWSLLDNLELAEGYEMQFGLVKVDRKNNFERKIRESAKYYAEICKSNSIEVL